MVNYDYLFNKGYYGDDLNKNHTSNKKLGCRIISDGIVLPHKQQVPGHDMLGGGGVVDNTGKYIEGTFLHDNPSREYKPENIKYSNETVIYMGMFVAIGGHCLTDNIKRLWFLESEIYTKYFKGYKLIYVPM